MMKCDRQGEITYKLNQNAYFMLENAHETFSTCRGRLYSYLFYLRLYSSFFDEKALKIFYSALICLQYRLSKSLIGFDIFQCVYEHSITCAWTNIQSHAHVRTFDHTSHASTLFSFSLFDVRTLNHTFTTFLFFSFWRFSNTFTH